MQDKQLEFREELRRAKGNREVEESTRAGKSLMEVIAKRGGHML
jgi:hypothetical protein